jgi:four helix bundle protein
MAMIRSFEEIEVWQNARTLTDRIYVVSGNGNFASDFGLRNQICRSAVSIMNNIAEGFESSSRRVFLRYLNIAKSSAGELRSMLYVARDRSYVSRAEFDALHDQIRKISSQLANFQKHIRSKL